MVVRIYKFEKVDYSKLQKTVGQDHFARNGYIVRDGKVLGVSNDDAYYLYVDAPDEFFKTHESEITEAGGKLVEGPEYESVKSKIEEEENNVATGLALFG
uniref:Uncharacterized protein n=1 Tax=uncultured euryarchaeote Alv-FOS5 TaxID=337891 RepID=Q3SB85_9EURY|nr:hypothetical protein [uncultured euryarchaeote Alv-FOS5]